MKKAGEILENLNKFSEEEQKTLHDKTFRPIYVGDYVAHIKGGYNSAVSVEIGKVIAIDTEKEKIQVDKNGSKSWIKPSLCILTIDREKVELPKPTYADGRTINHSLYDLGLQNMEK